MKLLYLGNNLLFSSPIVVTVENEDDCSEGMEKIEQHQRKKEKNKRKSNKSEHNSNCHMKRKTNITSSSMFGFSTDLGSSSRQEANKLPFAETHNIGRPNPELYCC
jgi:hypothetical protein